MSLFVVWCSLLRYMRLAVLHHNCLTISLHAWQHGLHNTAARCCVVINHPRRSGAAAAADAETASASAASPAGNEGTSVPMGRCPVSQVRVTCELGMGAVLHHVCTDAALRVLAAGMCALALPPWRRLVAQVAHSSSLTGWTCASTQRDQTWLVCCATT